MRSFCPGNHGRDHPPPPQDAGEGHEPPTYPTAEVAPSPEAGFLSRIRSPPRPAGHCRCGASTGENPVLARLQNRRPPSTTSTKQHRIHHHEPHTMHHGTRSPEHRRGQSLCRSRSSCSCSQIHEQSRRNLRRDEDRSGAQKAKIWATPSCCRPNLATPPQDPRQATAAKASHDPDLEGSYSAAPSTSPERGDEHPKP